MIAHYYQVSKSEIKHAQIKIGLSYKDFREVIADERYIENHLDIDKSWLNLVEVFKDVQTIESTDNIGEMTFYGKETDKNFEPDGLINFLNYEDVTTIWKYLKSIEISTLEDFVNTFNSTEFTQFGNIDYSDSYDYLYLQFINLKDFYSKSEEEQSGVIVSIG